MGIEDNRNVGLPVCLVRKKITEGLSFTPGNSSPSKVRSLPPGPAGSILFVPRFSELAQPICFRCRPVQKGSCRLRRGLRATIAESCFATSLCLYAILNLYLFRDDVGIAVTSVSLSH